LLFDKSTPAVQIKPVLGAAPEPQWSGGPATVQWRGSVGYGLNGPVGDRPEWFLARCPDHPRKDFI